MHLGRDVQVQDIAILQGQILTWLPVTAQADLIGDGEIDRGAGGLAGGSRGVRGVGVASPGIRGSWHGRRQKRQSGQDYEQVPQGQEDALRRCITGFLLDLHRSLHFSPVRRWNSAV